MNRVLRWLKDNRWLVTGAVAPLLLIVFFTGYVVGMIFVGVMVGGFLDKQRRDRDKRPASRHTKINADGIIRQAGRSYREKNPKP